MFRAIANIIKLSGLFLWTVFSLLFASFMLVITFFNERVPMWYARVIYAPIMMKIAGAKLDVKGQEFVDFTKPHIFMANHQSLIDIPIMMGINKSGSYFIAKHELKKIPFFGWYMAAVGMIFVKRGAGPDAVRSMRKAGELIRKGKSVVMFPEGTRSKTGEIGSFKKGGFHVALEAGVEIVPISIRGAEIVLPRKLMNARGYVVKIRIGKPISLDGYKRENVAELVALAEQRIKDLHSV